MIGRIHLDEDNNKELGNRIIVRLENQSVPEIQHVLTKLFPASPKMRVRSMSEEMEARRYGIESEFFNMLENEDVDHETFKVLSDADKPSELIMSRGNFKPTRFVLTLECSRTPFKNLFDECKETTCESCIERRIVDFQTTNLVSLNPWKVKVDKVEQRPLSICKNCGNMLTKKDAINMQNERLLYTCSTCGHKGWTVAK